MLNQDQCSGGDIVAVLRCPYCGKQISVGSEYCSHCGKQIDKLVVDNYWSGQQEGASVVFKIIGVIVLWVLIGTFVNGVLMGAGEWPIIIVSTLLTFIVVMVIIAVKRSVT